MALEEKLDEIIAILVRIEEKLDLKHISVSTKQEEIEIATPVIVLKPTKSQLEFKRMIEFANHLDRKFFFSAIRKNVMNYMEIKQLDPGFSLSFTPQFLNKIDEKITKTQAQFYKDLKVQTLNYAKAVEREGEEVLQRAIGRLTVRAK